MGKGGRSDIAVKVVFIIVKSLLQNCFKNVPMNSSVLGLFQDGR